MIEYVGKWKIIHRGKVLACVAVMLMGLMFCIFDRLNLTDDGEDQIIFS